MDLITYIGQLEGPSREADAAIWQWADPDSAEACAMQGIAADLNMKREVVEAQRARNLRQGAPKYTESLDAALSLFVFEEARLRALAIASESVRSAPPQERAIFQVRVRVIQLAMRGR